MINNVHVYYVCVCACMYNKQLCYTLCAMYYCTCLYLILAKKLALLDMREEDEEEEGEAPEGEQDEESS